MHGGRGSPSSGSRMVLIDDGSRGSEEHESPLVRPQCVNIVCFG